MTVKMYHGCKNEVDITDSVSHYKCLRVFHSFYNNILDRLIKHSLYMHMLASAVWSVRQWPYWFLRGKSVHRHPKLCI